jgi:hypothetical protein
MMTKGLETRLRLEPLVHFFFSFQSTILPFILHFSRLRVRPGTTTTIALNDDKGTRDADVSRAFGTFFFPFIYFTTFYITF